jgi:hypothetical protein
MSKVAHVPEVDPTLPKVELTLAKQTYHLCFTFDALAVAESEFRKRGIKVNLIEALDLSSLGASQMAPLLYAALITHDPEITIDQVSKLVTFRDLAKIFNAIIKAYEASLAEPDKDDKAAPLDAE